MYINNGVHLFAFDFAISEQSLEERYVWELCVPHKITMIYMNMLPIKGSYPLFLIFFVFLYSL